MKLKTLETPETVDDFSKYWSKLSFFLFLVFFFGCFWGFFWSKEAYILLFTPPFSYEKSKQAQTVKTLLCDILRWQLSFLHSKQHTSAAKIKQNNAERDCLYLTVEIQDEIFQLAQAAATTVSHSLLTKMCSSIARPPLFQLGVGWRGRRMSLDLAACLGMEKKLPAVVSCPTEVWKPASLQHFFFSYVSKLARTVCLKVSEQKDDL